jgi:hypothetical protein
VEGTEAKSKGEEKEFHTGILHRGYCLLLRAVRGESTLFLLLSKYVELYEYTSSYVALVEKGPLVAVRNCH